jgi:hypothetical protein
MLIWLENESVFGVDKDEDVIAYCVFVVLVFEIGSSPSQHCFFQFASSETYCSILFRPLGTNCRTELNCTTNDIRLKGNNMVCYNAAKWRTGHRM